MFYVAESTWQRTAYRSKRDRLQVGFCTIEELEELQRCEHLFGSIPLSEGKQLAKGRVINKLDAYYGYAFGILHILLSRDTPPAVCPISFYLLSNTLVLVCDDEKERLRLQNSFLSMDASLCTLEKCTAFLLGAVLSSITEQLETVEEDMVRLDESIMRNETRDFTGSIRSYRRFTLYLSHFMEQLSDVCENLLEDENTFFKERHLHPLKIMQDRVERMRGRVIQLQEYVQQLCEEYQAQQDLKLNQTMYVFTVVTVIFLPLSLIVGWYGMNFTAMPEVTWKYGYLFVIVLSVSVVGVLILYLKKKRLLK